MGVAIGRIAVAEKDRAALGLMRTVTRDPFRKFMIELAKITQAIWIILRKGQESPNEQRIMEEGVEIHALCRRVQAPTSWAAHSLP